MTVALFVVRQAGRFRSSYRGRFLGSLATRYVGHSSNACKSPGLGGGQTLLNGYPKGLSAKCLSKQACLIRPVINVDGTGTQIHDRVLFINSPPSTARTAKESR